MPEVTGVKERRGKARVFVDGEFWAEVDAGVAAERGLREGAVLSSRELRGLRIAGERPLAMGRALNLLGYRARARGEVRARLLRAGYAGETVELVVERLDELGYLDDEEFARTVARDRARKYGPRRVLADLKQRGVEGETARAAVEQQFQPETEYRAAFGAAARRYNMGKGSGAEARRVYGFLVRRGYSAEVCAEVARHYREGHAPETEEHDIGD